MRLPQSNTRNIGRQRRGTSHVLTIIVQIPLLVLIIATIIEVSSILLTQVGLRYSAASTARAAIVWLPANGTVDERLEQIRVAANSSFAPYATGRASHVGAVQLDSNSQNIAEAFHQSFTQFAKGDGGNNLLRNKMKYTRAAMRIEIDVYDEFDRLTGRKTLRSRTGHVVVNFVGKQAKRMIDPDNPDIDVRISFEKPIDLPGVGMFLGQRASWSGARFYSRTFQSNCSLTLEGIKTANHRLGVKYDVFNELR
jgi:hypothetical protein